MKAKKILFLVLMLAFAIFLFIQIRSNPQIKIFISSLGYLGVFISGLFYSYGATVAPSTAVLLSIAKQQNIFLSGIIGGAGALVSDLFIFLFIKYEFQDEIKSVKNANFLNKMKVLEKRFSKSFNSIMYVISAILITIPLSTTEMGVSLMTSIKNLSVKKFAILVYILHTGAIMSILFIGTKIA